MWILAPVFVENSARPVVGLSRLPEFIGTLPASCHLSQCPETAPALFVVARHWAYLDLVVFVPEDSLFAQLARISRCAADGSSNR
jgi:hypothetical protein